MKTFEFNGVLEYAHCFSFEIKAKTKKEAIALAKEKVKTLPDPATAEYQGYIIDKPILLPTTNKE